MMWYWKQLDCSFDFTNIEIKPNLIETLKTGEMLYCKKEISSLLHLITHAE
jgi:hypothetical protein